MASPSVTPRARANNAPPRGKLGLGMFGFGDLAALVSASTGVAVTLAWGTTGCGWVRCFGGGLLVGSACGLAAATAGLTGPTGGLGLAVRVPALRGFRAAAFSALAASSARACASSVFHTLLLIRRHKSNLASALTTSFINILYLHAVFTQGGSDHRGKFSGLWRRVTSNANPIYGYEPHSREGLG